MTNQEWLLTLEPKDCALFCLAYLPKIGRSCLSSRCGVDWWLQSEHLGFLDPFVNEFNQIIKMENEFVVGIENNVIYDVNAQEEFEELVKEFEDKGE